ncbi:helix-turn-helix transcriptional regulator [Paenibacillus segetis]|uniref:AraC family transcriptional regulator n=1 Tax=Paenibacillus segetis TaxID=1325360 RepID=A0ABQ1Y7D5_9BACL|nr:helix-turn-helix transcriptional regulator [Paenibacillus segetis]GGH14360.1 AraC family transcriptional regulator [Paenibacillus segetis]
MLNLLFREEAVLFSIDSLDAEMHRHHMLQIIYAVMQPIEITIGNMMFQTQFVIIDTNVLHKVNTLGTATHNVLVDPSSALYSSIYAELLLQQPYVCIDHLWKDYNIGSCDQLYEVIQGLVEKNKIQYVDLEQNEQMEEVITAMRRSGKFYTQTEMASLLNYSPSHFSRLFSEKYGVAYSSYIILHKLKRAFILMNEGYSLTSAAHEAGFSHSAHLASVAKKTLGMSLTQIKKDSINLKVIPPGQH